MTCLGTAAAAAAHGAFPQSAFVYPVEADEQHIVVGTSFGLLKTTDGGATWFWICEEAPGYEGNKPKMNVTKDGTVLVGGFDGVAVSSSKACGWAFATGPENFVSDVFVEADATSSVVLLSEGQPDGTFKNQVWESTDQGGSWQQLGTDLDPKLLAFNIRSAASNPDVLLVTATIKEDGASAAKGVLFKSTDRGESWTSTDIPGATSSNTPHVLGIHPTDPDLVFIRLDGDDQDALIVSRDGGNTFTEELARRAELFGFTISPDGKTVLVGFGDPKDFSVDVVDADMGIYRAAAADLKFKKDFDGAIGCLAWVSQGLFACTSQFVHGYELGLSPSGKSEFDPILTLSGVEDTLSCSTKSTVGELCPPLWDDTCELIGKCGIGSDSGAGDAGSVGGDDSSGDNCGCRSVSGLPNGASTWCLMVALAWFSQRRWWRSAARHS